MDFEFETTRTGLANAFAAAGAELLAYMGSSSALAAIPDTDPPKYVAAGPLKEIAKLLPAFGDAAEKPTGDLTDEQIKKVALEAVAAGSLSWTGFEEDERGFYTVPMLSKCHYQFARAIERAAIAAYLARQSQAAQPSELMQKVKEALTLAKTICDAVPNRAHKLPEGEPLRHLGKLVNYQEETGQHGYALIRDTLAELCTHLAGQSQATKAQAVPVGHVVTWNKGGSGEVNSIEPIGKSGYSLAAELPEGTLLYLATPISVVNGDKDA